MATNPFSKFFGGGNSQQPAQQGQQGPQPGQQGGPLPSGGQQFNPQTVGNVQQQPNPQSPGASPQQGGAGGTEQQTTPLDGFSKIWDTPSTPEGGAPRDPTKFTYPKLNPQTFSEGVAKMDFTRNLNPDLVTKALGGDAEAFRETLNAAAREAFSSSFQASDRYYSRVFSEYDNSVNERIPKEVGRRETQNLVRANLKSMDHPALSPFLETVQAQMQQAYPQASPQEIAAKSKEYFVAMAKEITSQSESDQTSSQSPTPGLKSKTITDFSSW